MAADSSKDDANPGLSGSDSKLEQKIIEDLT